jgi:hypothetical protein
VANLVLGPILRHVAATEATVWLETDVACEVEVLGVRAPTFLVEGHHYALLELTGLEPGTTYEYTVDLDGERAWPEPDSSFPASVLRTLDRRGEIELIFGSCRVSLPHEPPYVLHESEHEHAQGIDALRTLALRLTRTSPDSWPQCLLMLGDQIYADDLSPALLELTRGRGRPADAPADELADFEEYTLAYREAWTEPVIRWLLSTVPTAMIFDDHEVHAQWKTSQAWLDEMRAKPWYDRHISGGLMAYWIYQHIGNLSVSEIRDNDLLERVRSERDAGPLLREQMTNADRQAGHSRWSFARDLGSVRLVAIDTRAGREVTPGHRKIVDDGEWDWITARATGDFDHLVLASSVPFFLPPALHYAEAWDEAIADGAWGARAARVAEWIRRAAVMDHWASFQRSFHRLGALLEEVATGSRGRPPASVVMLSGDVHHCYLAEVGFRRGTQARSPTWQCVCSAYRKDLSRREKLAMKLGNSHAAERLTRVIARASASAEARVGWRLVDRPSYENQVATLSLAPGRARVRVETTAGADWRSPTLETVFEHQLVGRPGHGQPRSPEAEEAVHG